MVYGLYKLCTEYRSRDIIVWTGLKSQTKRESGRDLLKSERGMCFFESLPGTHDCSCSFFVGLPYLRKLHAEFWNLFEKLNVIVTLKWIINVFRQCAWMNLKCHANNVNKSIQKISFSVGLYRSRRIKIWNHFAENCVCQKINPSRPHGVFVVRSILKQNDHPAETWWPFCFRSLRYY